jgi:hypothetical protein
MAPSPGGDSVMAQRMWLNAARNRLPHRPSPLARLGITGLLTTMTAVLPVMISAGPAAAEAPGYRDERVSGGGETF